MSRIYSFLAALATVILFALVVWQMGYKAAQRDAKELEAKQLGQAFEQGREFGTVRDRVVTEYVDRVQIVEKRGATFRSMYRQRLMLPALLILALCACTTQPQRESICLPLETPALLMTPPRALHSLPSPQPTSPTTPPATPTPSN